MDPTEDNQIKFENGLWKDVSKIEELRKQGIIKRKPVDHQHSS